MSKKINDKINKIKTSTISLLIIMLVMFLAILIIVFMSPIYNLQSQIDALPHKVCHNETIIEEVYLVCSSNIRDFSCCKEGFYDSRGYEAIGTLNNKTCIVKGTKEVCEIK